MARREDIDGHTQERVTETECAAMWQTGGTEGVTLGSDSQEQIPTEYMMKQEPAVRPRTTTVLAGGNPYISSAHPGIAGRSHPLASAHLQTDEDDRAPSL